MLLSLLLLGLLSGLGFVGYRVYTVARQAVDNVREKAANLPEISLPEVQLPDVALPELEETLPEETAPIPETDSEVSGDITPEPKPDLEPTPPPSTATAPPLILSNSGNPNTTAPGGGNGVVSVPGFAPGTNASAIANRLGSPTRQSASPSATTAVYELDPNRASVAYVYDAGGTTVQQAEAVFAPSYDRLIMRVALAGMLDGQSTREIETGLEQVRTGQVERYPFEQNGLTGSIERNSNGFIHIYVR